MRRSARPTSEQLVEEEAVESHREDQGLSIVIHRCIGSIPSRVPRPVALAQANRSELIVVPESRRQVRGIDDQRLAFLGLTLRDTYADKAGERGAAEVVATETTKLQRLGIFLLGWIPSRTQLMKLAAPHMKLRSPDPVADVALDVERLLQVSLRVVEAPLA